MGDLPSASTLTSEWDQHRLQEGLRILGGARSCRACMYHKLCIIRDRAIMLTEVKDFFATGDVREFHSEIEFLCGRLCGHYIEDPDVIKQVKAEAKRIEDAEARSRTGDKR